MVIDEKLAQNDVVISSRIRLARNIADFPFVSTCSDDQRRQIESTVRNELGEDDALNELSFLDSMELEALERQFLLDLELISSEETALNEEPVKPTLTDSDTTSEPSDTLNDLCVTINEEDHIRITVTRNDFNLGEAWNQISNLDDKIEEHLNYAFSPRWGYLTACPANVGTGMRVSVLVHLPALVITAQTDKVFRSVQRINVIARGLFGDNANGDFFRISNQATLGCNEKELIKQVSSVIPALVKYEREARNFLLKENPAGIKRQVDNALSDLCQCDLEDTSPENNEEIMSLLSRVRMGVSIGLLGQKEADRVNRLFTLVHLRHRLFAAVTREDYTLASEIRDRIESIETQMAASDDSPVTEIQNPNDSDGDNA